MRTSTSILVLTFGESCTRPRPWALSKAEADEVIRHNLVFTLHASFDGARLILCPSYPVSRATGTGLGLVLTNSIVKCMGGEIDFESVEDVGVARSPAPPVTPPRHCFNFHGGQCESLVPPYTCGSVSLTLSLSLSPSIFV